MGTEKEGFVLYNAEGLAVAVLCLYKEEADVSFNLILSSASTHLPNGPNDVLSHFLYVPSKLCSLAF